jgi:DNA recombination protein RmuC
MPELLLPVVLVLAVLGLGALAVLAWRLRREGSSEASGGQLREALERIERELRDELARQGQASRADLAALQQLLLAQVSEATRTHNEQIDTLRTQVALTQAGVGQSLAQATQALAQQAQSAREAQDTALRAFGTEMAARLQALSDGNRQQLAEVREGVQSRLVALQEGNERKLEQMRATVDEKLHATLEQRLGESFRQVAERLEQVHKGLGEMQGLARDVGSLNRVLTNVKTRGIFGEVQLAALLEQVFTPEQYGANVETVPGSGARVEFAVRLPGRGDAGSPVWLPIDAKFPREDYERLLDAQDRADPAAVEAASRALETRLNTEARTIREKYLAAPHTTDFAILFLPTESLYAEALRRPGLVQALQREHRVALTGPTTLLATLSSLQMGFRTLALEKRSAEVWQVLGAVKTEFAKFGEVLAKTRKKLTEAASTIDAAEVRTRAMTRQLRAVEALPDTQAAALLPGLGDAGASAEDSDGSGDPPAEHATGA